MRCVKALKGVSFTTKTCKITIYVNFYFNTIFWNTRGRKGQIFICLAVLQDTHNILISINYFSADELLLTEMVFNGVFNDLNAEQTVSLLSCFVFQEKVVYRYWLFKIYLIAK